MWKLLYAPQLSRFTPGVATMQILTKKNARSNTLTVPAQSTDWWGTNNTHTSGKKHDLNHLVRSELSRLDSWINDKAQSSEKTDTSTPLTQRSCMTSHVQIATLKQNPGVAHFFFNFFVGGSWDAFLFGMGRGLRVVDGPCNTRKICQFVKSR